MNGNEEVGAGLVGRYGALFQFHEAVVGAGHHHVHILIGRFDLLRQPAGNIQRDGFLVGFPVPAHAAGVLTAMTGVDDHGFEPETRLFSLLRKRRHGDCKKGGSNKQKQ